MKLKIASLILEVFIATANLILYYFDIVIDSSKLNKIIVDLRSFYIYSRYSASNNRYI